MLFPLEANSCSDGSLIAAVLKAADSPRHPNFSQRVFPPKEMLFPSKEMLCVKVVFTAKEPFSGKSVTRKGKKHAVSYIWVFDKLDL